MADTKVVELIEGARIAIDVTVNEDLVKGRKLNDEKAGKLIKTKADGSGRYITRKLLYPFPAGFVSDPITKKPAKVEMTPSEMATAIGHWVKQMDELQANGGKYRITLADGKVMEREAILAVPTKSGPSSIVPSLIGESGVFGKGFKLSIQGPVNAMMADAFLLVTTKTGTKKVKATTVDGNDVW